jgi:hypothetical protein
LEGERAMTPYRGFFNTPPVLPNDFVISKDHDTLRPKPIIIVLGIASDLEVFTSAKDE